MKAVILVGGEGTRLRPLTYTCPKSLLPICNVPFLERQMAWLAGHGVDEVVLSLGYLPDAFVRHFPEGNFRGMSLHYAVEDTPLGTAGAICFAAQGIAERILVCNGDVLTALDVTALVEMHEHSGAQATIALTQVTDPSAFGVVPTDDDGRVLAFVEKPSRKDAPTDWVNAGTYVLEPSVLESIPPDRNVSIERETFPGLIGQGLFAMKSDAYWIDIGTPEKFLQAHADFMAGVVESAGDGLTEPVTVGAGSSVADDATVEGSVLGRDCVVASGAEIVRSVLLDGVRVAPDAVVSDSILGAGAIVGDKAVCDGCVLGDGVVLNPGARHVRERIDLRDGALRDGDPREGDK